MGLSYSRVCRNKFCDTSSSQASSAESVFNPAALPLRDGKAVPMHRALPALLVISFAPRGARAARGPISPRLPMENIGTSCRAVKKYNLYRRGAETQRNGLWFSNPCASAPLR
jgi:hypothetical protein